MKTVYNKRQLLIEKNNKEYHQDIINRKLQEKVVKRVYNKYKLDEESAKNKIIRARINERNHIFYEKLWRNSYGCNFYFDRAINEQIREKKNIKYRETSYKQYKNLQIVEDVTEKFDKIFEWLGCDEKPEEINFVNISEYTNEYGEKIKYAIYEDGRGPHTTAYFKTAEEVDEEYKIEAKELEEKLNNLKKKHLAFRKEYLNSNSV